MAPHYTERRQKMPAVFKRLGQEWGVSASADVISTALETGNPVIIEKRDGSYAAALLGLAMSPTTATILESHTLRYPSAYIRRMDVAEPDDRLPVGKRADLVFEDGEWAVRHY